MASEPKDYAFFFFTSKTEATENKVEFFKLRIHGKGISVP